MISPYQAFKTSDGELVIGGGNDNLFRKLCDVLGHPEWVDDPRFATNGLRVENKPTLIPLIEGVTAAKSSAEWADLLDKAGVPNAPVQTIDQVREHPQTAALDILRRGGDDKLQFFGLPLSLTVAAHSAMSLHPRSVSTTPKSMERRNPTLPNRQSQRARKDD